MIGQPSFSSSAPVTTQTGLNDPRRVAFDSSGNLWVADTDNNRVLKFAPPLTTGEAASVVIGQSSFTSSAPAATLTGLNAPRGVAFDASGNLWVTDTGNNRVLEFASPATSGESATLVIGQTNFTSNRLATTQSGLNAPREAKFDSSGNLWVTDTENNRILEFTAPLTTGEAASVVLGQSVFTTSGFATSRGQLHWPSGMAIDRSGNLWVADFFNNRILEFTGPLTTGEYASVVIGESSFTSIAGVPTRSNLYSPNGVAFDSSGNLWVVDYGSSRVLEFTAPLTTGESAAVVIGQTTFTSFVPDSTQSGLNLPPGAAFDSSGNLWVADADNNRVLEFVNQTATTTTTTSSTGQTTTAPITTTSSTALITSSAATSTATATSSTARASTTNTQTSTSSSQSATGAAGIPEFPYQSFILTILTVLIVTSYLLVRRHASPRGRVRRL